MPPENPTATTIDRETGADSGNDLDALLTRINQLANGEPPEATPPAPSAPEPEPEVHPALQGHSDNTQTSAWRPNEPNTLEEAGVAESQVEHLVLRCLAAMGELNGHQLADQHAIPFRMIEPILAGLKASTTCGLSGLRSDE